MIRVAVVGASGYAARELLGYLFKHPYIEVTMVTSRQEDCPRLDEIHPRLEGKTDLRCEAMDVDQLADRVDVAMLCLPHGASLAVVPELRSRGIRVIDLSADYRLKDPAIYQEWYHQPHTDASGLAEAVYGLPEIAREPIVNADLIANPGCYTSTSILALAPLVAGNLIDRSSIIIDAKSGVSGAGRAPKLGTLFAECNESLSAYGVGTHRHMPEIDEQLSEVGVRAGLADPVQVLFTPHLIPMDRGILVTIYARPLDPSSELTDLGEMARQFYRGEPFVRVLDRLPTTKEVSGTNEFRMAIRLVRGRIVIVAVLDNLVKGAAGVAIQNLNLRHGWPETTGLV